MANDPEQEKELRLRLAKDLGVEFYEPNDPNVNVDVQKSRSKIEIEPRKRLLGQVRQISVADLIHQCNDAVGKMSAQNPHKQLLWNCAFALRQLVDRLESKASS